MEHPPAPPPPFPAPALLLLGGLVLICLAVEGTLLGADWQLWGSPRWRLMAYQYGGFWTGLLLDWQPNYALQPVTMFLTYAFLHAGPGHLLGNMLTLAGLGVRLAQQVGAWALGLLCALSAIGGGLAFALLVPTPVPMVGASGALFGLAGAWVIQDRQDRRRAGLRDRSLWIVLLLVLLNLGLWVMQDGQLAWQAHLGGGLTGMACAAAYAWRAKIRS